MDLEVQAKFKECSKCKVNQPIDEFYIRTDHPGRRASHCKSCKHVRHVERMNDDNDDYRQRSINNSIKWQKKNPLRTKYLIARSSALNGNRRRIIEFSLTYKECIELWNKGCHYCSTTLLDKCGSSLDRRDNKAGYTLDNVLPCCGDCNKIRNIILTVEETEIAITAVMAYRRSTGV